MLLCFDFATSPAPSFTSVPPMSPILETIISKAKLYFHLIALHLNL